MNYIHKLQQQVAKLQKQLEDAQWANDALLDYVESSKFHGPEGYGGPRYVHVGDIIQRAQLTRRALL
jgi:hypothetical protein